MNKRQVKKFLRKSLVWERIDERLSYLALSKHHNDKRVQRVLRNKYGHGVYWYSIPALPQPEQRPVNAAPL